MFSPLFKGFLFVAVCWSAACVPPDGGRQSQPGSQAQQQPAAAYDDPGSNDDTDDFFDEGSAWNKARNRVGEAPRVLRTDATASTASATSRISGSVNWQHRALEPPEPERAPSCSSARASAASTPSIIVFDSAFALPSSIVMTAVLPSRVYETRSLTRALYCDKVRSCVTA